MYYWKHEDFYAILNSTEELEVLRRAQDDDYEGAKYIAVGCKPTEDKMNRYLLQWYTEEPDVFYNRFVKRYAEREEAIALLPGYLDMFAMLTKKILPKKLISDDDDETHFERLRQKASPDFPKSEHFYVTFIKKGRFLWSKPTYDNYIMIEKSSILRLNGTVDDFTVLTTSAEIVFNTDFVRTYIGA